MRILLNIIVGLLFSIWLALVVGRFAAKRFGSTPEAATWIETRLPAFILRDVRRKYPDRSDWFYGAVNWITIRYWLAGLFLALSLLTILIVKSVTS